MKSDTHSTFGAGARNCRFTRSAGQGVVGLETVVRLSLPRTTPRSPMPRISRSTVHRAADVAYPARAQADLGRDLTLAHPGLAQPNHLPPAFLLRRRQLAHVHMPHAAHLARSYLRS